MVKNIPIYDQITGIIDKQMTIIAANKGISSDTYTTCIFKMNIKLLITDMIAGNAP